MTRPWLLPLNPLYRAGLAMKNGLYNKRRLTVRRLANPVISVGSISAGGAGKTPSVLALAEMLTRHGYAVDVLSRGYGRESKVVAQVDPAGSAAEFGDEPLELARAGLSVFVGAERYEAGLLAEQVNARAIHLLDDGFQHRRLHRTFDIVLVTLADLRDHLLPAGNLREPLRNIRRADAIIVREEEAEEIYAVTSRLTRAFHWTLRRTLKVPADAPLQPFAFAGIARPETFFPGVSSVGRRAFADHHAYSLVDCESLVAAARQVGADGFVTTAKDAVKLTPAHHASLAAVGPVAVAALECSFLYEQDQVMRQLGRVLAAQEAKADRLRG